jgi:hypothetical protein
MEEKKNLNLSKTEEILIVGLQARERELFREMLQPLQEAFKSVVADIETRLGLPAGSVGTTHTLDQTAWKLKENAPIAE